MSAVRRTHKLRKHAVTIPSMQEKQVASVEWVVDHDQDIIWDRRLHAVFLNYSDQCATLLSGCCAKILFGSIMA